MGLTVGQSVASDCYAAFAGITLPENICIHDTLTPAFETFG